MHGNERNYCIALITLDPDAMAGWAAENGMAGASYAEIVGSPQVAGRWSAATSTTLNTRLNRWETIKKWMLLDHDLTVESGELTPSLKVKRKVVEDNYTRRDRRAATPDPCSDASPDLLTGRLVTALGHASVSRR